MKARLEMAPAVVVTLSPAFNTETFFETWFGLAREGKINPKTHMPSFVQVVSIMHDVGTPGSRTRVSAEIPRVQRRRRTVGATDGVEFPRLQYRTTETAVVDKPEEPVDDVMKVAAAKPLGRYPVATWATRPAMRRAR